MRAIQVWNEFHIMRALGCRSHWPKGEKDVGALDTKQGLDCSTSLWQLWKKVMEVMEKIEKTNTMTNTWGKTKTD